MLRVQWRLYNSVLEGVESMVSVVEAHTPASRGIIPQNRLEDETIVSWNGEDVMHCDPIVKEAMRAYISQYKMQQGRAFCQEK